MVDYTPQLKRILPAWIRTESGGNPNAVSSAGAMGLLQLMPDTARRFGVKNPYDKAENLAAGLKYGNFLMNRYKGDLPIALMAYHAGEGNVDNYLKGKPSGVGPLTKAYPNKVLGDNALSDAGFKSYNQRPEPVDSGKFPITLIPGVEPQAPVKEAEKMPYIAENTDFLQKQAGVRKSKLLAKMLLEQKDQDPNAMVSGHIVKVNPITALLQGLRTGVGTYSALNAENQQGALDQQKMQALQEMIKSGNTDINSLAANGMIEPDKLAAALAQRQAQTEFNSVYGNNGEILSFNKATGEVNSTGSRSDLYAPQAVYNRGLAMSASKGVEAIDPNTQRPYYTTQGAMNPQAFGNYDQPSRMMPVPGGQQQPIAPYAVQPDVTAPPVQQPVAAPVQQPSQAEITRAVEFAKIPANVKQQQEVGAVKNQQEADLAQQKADIENNAKLKGKKGEAQLNAQLELPQIQANAEYTKQLIDEISSHPGLSSMVGAPNPLAGGFGSFGAMPGTDAAGFKAKLDQLQGKQFLEAFQSLKGGGQITEVEGKKATDAIAAMSTAQKEDDFKRELNKLKAVIDSGYKRANAKAGGIQQPAQQPLSDEDLLKKYGGM